MVFRDYQNLTASAREQFPRTAGMRAFSHIDPFRLAQPIVLGAYDVGVIASHDTDLVPALEAVRELRLAHVEAAGVRDDTDCLAGRRHGG
jgi:hypothetical protein